MKIDLLLLLFVVVGWVGASSVGSRIASPRTPSPTPDPLWNPIDPRQFPPAKPTDTVHIQYVVAPLLKAEVGPIFGYFDLFHGGVAFTVVEQNFTWVVNYDSVDLNLFGSQMPVIHKAANGSRTLEWFSAGAAYCYKGIHPNYWSATPVGTVNGTAYNAYLQQFLIPFNSTWPYYEMFNVKNGNNGSLVLESRECFDFVLRTINFFNTIGANLHGSIKRNLVYWVADGGVQLVDTSNAKVWADVVDFYEMLELHWGSVSSFTELLKLLGQLLLGERFYLHVGDQYYQFKLEWPVLDVYYRAVPF